MKVMHACTYACAHVCALTDLAEDAVQTDRLFAVQYSHAVQDTDIVLLPGICKSWEHCMKRLH